MREILKFIVRYIHGFIFFALIVGVFVPGKYLIYYLIIWPAIYIHWIFNNDQCMMTDLENKLDDNHYNNIEEFRYFSYINFFKLCRKYNIYFDNIDDFTTKQYTASTILWIVGFFRLLIFYKKNISNFWKGIRKTFVNRFVCETCKA